MSTVTHNLTQPVAINTQPEPVMRLPATLVTTKPSDQGVPPLPPSRGLTPPTKRILLAKSTEHLTEALKEVMLELETPEPMIRKYKKYLQKQATESANIEQTKM